MTGLFQNRVYPPLEFGSSPNVANHEANAKFNDYEKIGRLIVEWAQAEEEDRPQDITELQTAIGNHIQIDPKFTKLRFEQGDDSLPNDYELVIRLPPKGQVSESEARIILNSDLATQIAELNQQLLTAVPAAQQAIRDQIATLESEMFEGSYDIPPLYQDFLVVNQDDSGKPISEIRKFYSRVADYTMRSCR